MIIYITASFQIDSSACTFLIGTPQLFPEFADVIRPARPYDVRHSI